MYFEMMYLLTVLCWKLYFDNKKIFLSYLLRSYKIRFGLSV